MGVAAPACEGENDSSASDIPAKCGLLTPEPGVDASALPPEFLVEGVEVAKVLVTKKRVSAALNNPRSVTESFEVFGRAARDAGFEIVGRDNEGFEAEVYVKKGRDLGAIQIRTSQCPEASVVFVNIVRT